MRRRWVGYVFVGAALVVVVGPILWVIRVALRPTDEYIGAPAEFGGSWTLENFATAWTSGGMGEAILHSATAVIVGTTLATMLSSLTGFALARFDFVGKRLTILLTTVALFLPAAALVIPLFGLLHTLGMLDSLVWLGVVYGVTFSAWATVFMRSFFTQLPDEVFEASAMDGAGVVRQFLFVALPMAKPAIATAFVLGFFLQWSELLFALLFLPSGEAHTVSMAVAQFSSQFRTGGPLTAAAMIVGTAPVLLLFAVGQRWIQAGAISGSVKD